MSHYATEGVAFGNVLTMWRVRKMQWSLHGIFDVTIGSKWSTSFGG
jgi:hypothetical protein